MRREAPVQRAIVAYLRRVLPDAIIHHSPNEGVRGGKAGWLDGALAKSAGQVAGFPDLIVIPWANIGPLFLEVKSATGRLSEAQAAMLDRLAAFGYRVAVVRSIDDVRERLAAWGIWTRDRSKSLQINDESTKIERADEGLLPRAGSNRNANIRSARNDG